MVRTGMTDEETEVRNALDRLGIEYEFVPCESELADTDVFCEHYGYPRENSANALLIKGKRAGQRRHVLCIVLADTRLDVNHVVRRKLDVRRISFASAEETRDITGMELGGVTPVAIPEDLPVWVDARVMERDYVILGCGNRSGKIIVSPELFEKTANTEVVEGLAVPMEPEQ